MCWQSAWQNDCGRVRAGHARYRQISGLVKASGSIDRLTHGLAARPERPLATPCNAFLLAVLMLAVQVQSPRNAWASLSPLAVLLISSTPSRSNTSAAASR